MVAAATNGGGSWNREPTTGPDADASVGQEFTARSAGV
jgi:hypothetical protein